MEIRSAIFVDVPALVNLASSSEHAAHWTPAQHLKLITSGDSVYLIAVDSSGPCGFIAGSFMDADGEIENIVVSPSRQREGIASALLKEFLKLARSREAKRMLLEVRASNAAAHGFYQKHGFTENGRRKNYYSAPQDDAVLYELTLKGDAPD